MDAPGAPSDDTAFEHTLKEHVIVAVVDVHADQHGPLDLEGPLEDRSDLIGCADHEASRSECLCVLHRVHRSEGDRKQPKGSHPRGG